MRKEGYVGFYLSIFIFGLFFMLPIGHAQAATLYFSPSEISRGTGQTFSSVIRVNTDGQAINAAQGSVVFDPAKIEVVSISKSGSIFNLWTQEPIFSNSEGTIEFEGGLPSPGYSGASGLLLTVSFRTKTATTVRGFTSVNLVSGAILANDGQGTNILTSLGKLTVSITPTVDTNVQPESTPSSSTVEAGGAPKVESSTHPDPTKWYSNNNPSFSWNLSADVTGVSYLITDKATSNPGPKSDGTGNKVSFTGISDGIQYFHIKFKENGVWGTIAHYQFNIDTSPPLGFSINTVTTDDIHPAISFETTDALSGIDHYEIKIGDNSWTNLSADQAGKPYNLSFDRIGTQTVYVKAVDKAGNATTESTLIAVSSAAIGSSIADWFSRLFNTIVNIPSSYGLFLILIIAMIGALILIFRTLGSSIDRILHRMNERHVMRGTERKADTMFGRLMDDMKDEIKFLETIGRRRPLGPEEKYLKSKLKQYVKALKDGK